MIDPAKEECFILADGPKKVGKTYKQLHYWIRQGVSKTPRGELSEPVKLESVLLPTLGTSVEAYHRFLRRLNGLTESG